jgi:hypothetical protein
MKNTPRKRRKPIRADDPRPEYQFNYTQSRTNRFADRVGRRTIAVVLEPDVSEVFDSSRSVNKLLRSVIAAVPAKSHATKRRRAG